MFFAKIYFREWKHFSIEKFKNTLKTIEILKNTLKTNFRVDKFSRMVDFFVFRED